MYHVVQEIDEAIKSLDYLHMLFDKVLSQTLSTDIWRATTTTSSDYSAEVNFLFLAFGILNNGLDTGTWHFMIMITSAKESATEQGGKFKTPMAHNRLIKVNPPPRPGANGLLMPEISWIKPVTVYFSTQKNVKGYFIVLNL